MIYCIHDVTAKAKQHLPSNYAPFLHTMVRNNQSKNVVIQYCMNHSSLIVLVVFIKCSFSKLKPSNPLKVFKCTFALLGILLKWQNIFDNSTSIKILSYIHYVSVAKLKIQEEECFTDILPLVMKNAEKLKK